MIERYAEYTEPSSSIPVTPRPRGYSRPGRAPGAGSVAPTSGRIRTNSASGSAGKRLPALPQRWPGLYLRIRYDDIAPDQRSAYVCGPS
jgi:hypothetical protein